MRYGVAENGGAVANFVGFMADFVTAVAENGGLCHDFVRQFSEFGARGCGGLWRILSLLWRILSLLWRILSLLWRKMADFVMILSVNSANLGMVKRMVMGFSKSLMARRRAAFPDRLSLCPLCPLW